VVLNSSELRAQSYCLVTPKDLVAPAGQSLDQRTGATPPRVAEKIRNDVERKRGVTMVCTLVVRPIDEHRPSNYQFSRHKTPEATILAVFAIVPHDEVFALRDDYFVSIPFMLEDVIVFAALVVTGTGMVIDVVSFVRLTRRIIDNVKRRLVVILILRLDAMFG
jgi:hypothetical protein